MAAVTAGKWGSVNINIIGDPIPVHFVLTGDFMDYQKAIVDTIEDAIL